MLMVCQHYIYDTCELDENMSDCDNWLDNNIMENSHELTDCETDDRKEADYEYGIHEDAELGTSDSECGGSEAKNTFENTNSDPQADDPYGFFEFNVTVN